MNGFVSESGFIGGLYHTPTPRNCRAFPFLLTGPPCISGSGVTRQPVFRVERQDAAFVGGRAAVAIVAIASARHLVVGVEGLRLNILGNPTFGRLGKMLLYWRIAYEPK